MAEPGRRAAPAVDAAGGWLARDTAHRFQDYAYLVGEALADRAAAVFTLWPALGTPPAPPALHSFPAHHHRLLGHGLATRALREAGARQLGLGHHFAPAWPARDHDADEQAAALVAAWRNDLCTGPVRRGAYPAPVLEVLGERTPALLDAVRPGDLETIAAPLDLLGVGYDQPAWVQARPGAPLGLDVGLVPDRERTGAPGSEGLTQVLTDLKAQLGEAGPPLVVALGGVWAEAPLPDGRVPDSGRVRFLEGHVQAVADAAARGVGVRGVLVGELLDRGEGLGLVRVDGGTGERVRKGSFGWVAGVVRGDEGGASPLAPPPAPYPGGAGGVFRCARQTLTDGVGRLGFAPRCTPSPCSAHRPTPARCAHDGFRCSPRRGEGWGR
ncbi:family 1 glycosylhydrolase [Deinococcus multiflagellatus]|uniref:Family 1 glycosylhydrolase n=1 Tax=Deinococcus multiflagellatus TaxID=1656887 RepID=A0ABW1ZL48_9DEIO